MTTPWTSGDIAECIDSTNHSGYLRVGGRYEVTEVIHDQHGRPWLAVDGGWQLWPAAQFRPAYQLVRRER